MLFEDFWIRPDGSVKGPLAQSEHAEEALRVLLRLPADFKIPRTQLFTGITQKTEDSARARGVPENVLAYLSRDQIDPRTWMIQKEGWIRVSKNKINVWIFNDATLDLIRRSDYWKHQTKASPYDMIEIDELSGNDKFEVPVRALRSRGSNAASLKEIGLRRGEFPHGEEIEESPEEPQRHFTRPGGYTDKAGDGKWLYQRIGENPATDQVRIDASPAEEDSFRINYFEVPEELRGKGIGKAAYLKWEKRLPKWVKKVTLYAAESSGFWESVGFEWGDGDGEMVKYLKHNNPEIKDMRVPMNLGPVSVRDPESGTVLRFVAEGPIEVHVDEEGAAQAGIDVNDLIASSQRIVANNPPLDRESRPVEGARLLIGFNVGIKKTWTIEGVLNLAFWVRRQQVAKAFKEGYAKPSAKGGDLGMTFLVQKGVWQPVGDKHAYPEDGTTLVLLNTISEDPVHFRTDMENLAEELATRLKQQAIIVEHQVKGIVEETVTMGPRH
jgi:GNAT superfamily N-acetyltransferase